MTTEASTLDAAKGPDPGPDLQPFDTSADGTSPLDLLRDRGRLFQEIEDGGDLGATVRRALLTAVAGAAIFGASLGAYSGSAWQVLAALLKMPILLVGTTLLTFPSFFVLQSWRAPRTLDWRRAMALLSTMLGATGLVWGALAPPVLFLVVSTRYYDLAQFLSVVVGAFGGVVGLAVLLGGYRRLCAPHDGPREVGSNPFPSGSFLVTYFAVFGVVGAQLGWMLRPFVGSPSLPFQIVRPLDPGDPGNIFAFLLEKLFGG